MRASEVHEFAKSVRARNPISRRQFDKLLPVRGEHSIIDLYQRADALDVTERRFEVVSAVHRHNVELDAQYPRCFQSTLDILIMARVSRARE
jgi:hypothetical protein